MRHDFGYLRYQSRAKHDVSPPWPCEGRESGLLAGLHIAGQGLPAPPGPVVPCGPVTILVSPDRPCYYPAG